MPYILQNQALHALSTIGEKDFKPVEMMGYDAYRYADGKEIRFQYVDGVKPFGLVALRTLDILRLQLAKQFPAKTKEAEKYAKIELSMAEYLSLTGLNSQKDAKKQLQEALLTLSCLRIDERNRFDYPILTSCEMLRSGIRATFSKRFLESLTGKGVYALPFVTAGLQIRMRKNPYAYYFLQKLTDHYNRNRNRQEAAGHIRVKSLIEATPSFPSYREIKTDGGITRRMFEPLRRDMDALSDILEWHYEEKESDSYAEWKKAMIAFHFKEGVMPAVKEETEGKPAVYYFAKARNQKKKRSK